MTSIERQSPLRWLLNRLLCMTPAEAAYRGGAAIKSQARRRLGFGRLTGNDPQSLAGGVRWLGVPQGIAADPYVAEAQAVAAGSVRLFSHRRFDLGAVPNWNRCPLTGVECPPLPSYRVSLTDASLVGDIKYVWEQNRHLQWVSLGQAWALTHEDRHLAALSVQLESWLDQCPYGQGPNWTSSLEFALRLLNWSLTWQLIGGETSPLFDRPRGDALRKRWLASINVHVRAIALHYSRHSSANNHLIGELTGVFVASCTWPFWPEVRRLGSQARAELETQALCQVAPDGVLKEQAFEYATFVFDLLFIVELAASAQGESMSAAYLGRLEGLCTFIRTVRTASGSVPMVGDADGAEAWRLDPTPGRCPFASMLRKGAWLRSTQDPLAEQAGRDELAWLMPRVSGAQTPAAAIALDFPVGGYHVFGSERGGGREVLGLMDAGPLGYLGIAAHGHADALQVWLALGGHPLLIDPGTYGYRVALEWREYFRGTSAHNTVCVGSLSQSVSGGRFMWTRKARTTLLDLSRSETGNLQLRAKHDGYRRLHGFEHERSLSFDAAGACLEVRDVVQGRAKALVELHWHIAPGWQVEEAGGSSFLIGRPGLRVRLSLSPDAAGGRVSMHKGEETPLLGWYSAAYGEKHPCTVLRWQGEVESARLLTRIEWQFADDH